MAQISASGIPIDPAWKAGCTFKALSSDPKRKTLPLQPNTAAYPNRSRTKLRNARGDPQGKGEHAIETLHAA